MNYFETIIASCKKRNVPMKSWTWEDWEIYSLAGTNKKSYCHYDVKDWLRIEYNRTTKQGVIKVRVDGYQYEYTTSRWIEFKEYFTKSKISWNGSIGNLDKFNEVGTTDRALKLALTRFIKKNVK